MSKPTILVTAATGKTGAAIVAQLRERNWPDTNIAIQLVAPEALGGGW